jgi:hypothetical protein
MAGRHQSRLRQLRLQIDRLRRWRCQLLWWRRRLRLVRLVPCHMRCCLQLGLLRRCLRLPVVLKRNHGLVVVLLLRHLRRRRRQNWHLRRQWNHRGGILRRRRHRVAAAMRATCGVRWRPGGAGCCRRLRREVRLLRRRRRHHHRRRVMLPVRLGRHETVRNAHRVLLRLQQLLLNVRRRPRMWRLLLLPRRRRLMLLLLRLRCYGAAVTTCRRRQACDGRMRSRRLHSETARPELVRDRVKKAPATGSRTFGRHASPAVGDPARAAAAAVARTGTVVGRKRWLLLGGSAV